MEQNIQNSKNTNLPTNNNIQENKGISENNNTTQNSPRPGFLKIKLFFLMMAFSVFASSSIFYFNAYINDNSGVVLANLIIDPSSDEHQVRVPRQVEFEDYTFSDTYLRYLEYIYGVEIREIPLWGSKIATYPEVNENEVMLGLSLIENRKIILFTEGLCDYLRWRTIFHELYHVLLNSRDEAKADTYAEERLKEIGKQRTADCEPIQ